MLRKSEARFDLAGYHVETIRITTQPFTEYTAENRSRKFWRSFTIWTKSPSRKIF